MLVEAMFWKKRKFWMLCLGVLFVLEIVLSIGEANLIDFVEAQEVEAPDYFKFSVDSDKHNDYGFTYPVTYQFSIPSGSSNLKAYKKYTESENWTKIPQKTGSDFFNGIEAARFDYDNNKAYISVAFSNKSDDIFLKIASPPGIFNIATYDGITKYYDNRDAAVTFSADDWCGDSYIDLRFRQACDMFTSKKIWLSVGVITQGFADDFIWGKTPPPIWSYIQEKIDAGYIEIVSHTRTHPNYLPYDDSEIGMSKQDIIDNLDLPALYKKGTQEYIWGFTSPHSRCNNDVYYRLGKYKYLTILAGYPYRYPKFYQDGSFPPWNTEYGLYERWNRWGYLENKALSELNYQFDKRTGEGKIYHIGFHPWSLDFSSGSKIDKHTDYVKGRKNLWYVGYAALMMYHYVKDQNIIGVEKKYKISALDKIFSYPNPCYPHKGQIVTIVYLPLNVEKIYIYTIAGELVRVLEKGDGIEERMRSAIATWDCRNEDRQEVARGVYIYLVITSEGGKKTGKIAIIK